MNDPPNQRWPTALASRFADSILACTDPDGIELLASRAANELAPLEARWLYARMAELTAHPSARMFGARARLPAIILRGELPPYRNVRVAERAQLFVAPGAARAGKILLIAFTCMRGSLFMPMLRLLLQLPFGRFDVLRLRAADDRDYTHGVPGFAHDWPGLAARLRLEVRGYAAAATIGASLGGFAALRAALLADLPLGISLSGRFSVLDWLRGARRVPDFDPLCACLRPRRTQLVACFAADHQQDSLDAARIAQVRPGTRLLAVQDVRDHNVVSRMIVDGSLDALLAELAALAPAAAPAEQGAA